MDNIDLLKSLLSTNQCDRLAKEKAAQDRIDDPKLPRHTVYQGDRKIQQLGQDTIENGIVLNNQSVAIGDVMLPLAKGNVLRRVDNTNGGALLGTAYRDALENDFDANGNRRSAPLSRNGGNEPSDPNNPNKPRKPSDRVPPPFGCVPPPSQCFWSTNPIAPDGFQNHGDAVVNENAQPTYLHCKAGASVPANLGCDFLNQKWSCSAGVCSLNPNGSYSSQAECEAALIPPPFSGGQCVGNEYTVVIGAVFTGGGTSRTYYFPRNLAGGSQNLAGMISFGNAQFPFFGALNNPVYSYSYSGTPTGFADFYPGGRINYSILIFDFPVMYSLVEGSEFVAAVVNRTNPSDPCGNLPSSCP